MRMENTCHDEEPEHWGANLKHTIYKTLGLTQRSYQQRSFIPYQHRNRNHGGGRPRNGYFNRKSFY